MRFDDSLRTVLAADTDSAFGAASAWRQIVDLIGRGRAAPLPEALDRLRAIRSSVSAATRAASARSLAFASPGVELVSLFAQEDLAIAAPVLRTATLASDEWVALLPALSPAGRSVLRHRRDLPAEVERALESFGATDFVLPYAPDDGARPAEAAELVGARTAPAPAPAPPTPPVGEGSFVALGVVAAGLPVVSEALRRSGDPALPPAPDPNADGDTAGNGFPISDLVARIEAFQRQRELSGPDEAQHPATAARTVLTFRFETDAAGAIRGVEGVARSPVIGLSLVGTAGPSSAVDGVASGAFRRRAPFRDARMVVGGVSEAAGSWRITAEPRFDPASGRFVGYNGVARRPRPDESAAPRLAGSLPIAPRSAGADSLRQLVHELRTPANAIAGFAELMEREMLGPVPTVYRVRAGTIRAHAADLIAAIDDLDTAARIEGGALDLRPGSVPLAPLLARALDDLAPLAALRGAAVSLTPVAPGLVLEVDDRAAERLIARLLGALVSACAPGERLSVAAMRDGEGHVLVVADRPSALAALTPDRLLSIDAEQEAALPGAPLLGAGFALRLAQNLAAELGGSLGFEPRRLTLRLPAAVTQEMGQTYAS
ncbi:sensor histidine kinase [uncultured Sphingomonas sp.]|uniref:sensor histidine kinase n=1 Tax=uncultured Sphingomonas sp. TaxID=158754 RepID=UPI0035CC0D53